MKLLFRNIFGIGASTPLMILCILSRQAIMKFRDKMLVQVPHFWRVVGS